jgi:hypothetical protein
MKNISFKIDGRLIKVEHRAFVRRGISNMTKTFCFSMKLEDELCIRAGDSDSDDEITNFGYEYPIDFIDNCYVPDRRSAEYVEHFLRDLPLYKAAVDKFKKLIAFT